VDFRPSSSPRLILTKRPGRPYPPGALHLFAQCAKEIKIVFAAGLPGQKHLQSSPEGELSRRTSGMLIPRDKREQLTEKRLRFS